MTGPYPPGFAPGPQPGYPGPLPPTPPYQPPYQPPRRPPNRLWPHRWLGVALLVATTLIALAAGLGYAVRGGGSHPDSGGRTLTAAAAQRAIQNYLDALMDRDIDAIARNTLCGIYDEVSDHRSDNAVAKMNSDAFRKQFSQAEVTAVDKIVYLSDTQAQALFTMRVNRVSGDQRQDRTQGVAQLLAVDGNVLVCSYVLRAAGSF